LKGEVYEFAAVFLLLNKGLASFSSYRYGQPLDLRLILQVVNTRLLELSLMVWKYFID
jgi:hypothetical protein